MFICSSFVLYLLLQGQFSNCQPNKERMKTLYRGYYTRREDMNFMYEWQEYYLTSGRRERVRYCSCHDIFEPTCNVLFIIWRNQFNKSRRQESWRHWTIRYSQRWHTEYTPLGSRMKWRMESLSGLVPSKTLSSI